MPSRITDPETLAAWATYEAQSRRAAAQYEAMPIAKSHAVVEVWGRCIHCGEKTRSRDGQCRPCKRTVVGR
jgi:hypothetical protein